MQDEQIKKIIIDRLSWDGRIDDRDVDVEFSEGKAVLKGTVPSYAARIAAERAALEIPGVLSVLNDLYIKHKDVELPGRENLKENIETLLELISGIDSKDIHVSSQDGHVELTGTVDAYWKKIRVGEMISYLKGVIGIRNDISVVPTESPMDKNIAEGIIQALEHDPRVDPASIDVEVKDGVVELSGTVPDRKSYDAALEIVQHSMGVIEIENRMNIL